MYVFFDLCFPFDTVVLSGIAPLDVAPGAPHRLNYVSRGSGADRPWEKEGNPRGQEGHCQVERASEKLKRWTVFERLCLLVSLSSSHGEKDSFFCVWS